MKSLDKGRTMYNEMGVNHMMVKIKLAEDAETKDASFQDIERGQGCYEV